MVDFPDQPGKMCDWQQVEAVDGAHSALSALSHRFSLYVATGAEASTPSDIQAAMQRVSLDSHVTGYFCKANLGMGKDSGEFYPTILHKLGLHANEVAMVGDNLHRDALPAARAGLKGIWFNPEKSSKETPDGIHHISHLEELHGLL